MYKINVFKIKMNALKCFIIITIYAIVVARTQHNLGTPHSSYVCIFCAILNNLSRFVHETRVPIHSFPVSYKA